MLASNSRYFHALLLKISTNHIQQMLSAKKTLYRRCIDSQDQFGAYSNFISVALIEHSNKSSHRGEFILACKFSLSLQRNYSYSNLKQGVTPHQESRTEVSASILSAQQHSVLLYSLQPSPYGGHFQDMFSSVN